MELCACTRDCTHGTPPSRTGILGCRTRTARIICVFTAILGRTTDDPARGSRAGRIVDTNRERPGLERRWSRKYTREETRQRRGDLCRQISERILGANRCHGHDANVFCGHWTASGAAASRKNRFLMGYTEHTLPEPAPTGRNVVIGGASHLHSRLSRFVGTTPQRRQTECGPHAG